MNTATNNRSTRAERVDHLAVLDARGDRKPDFGAVENQHPTQENREAYHRRQHGILLDRRPAKDERGLEGLRNVERNLRGADHRTEQLFGDDHAADGHQDLLQMPAVDRLDDQALEYLTADERSRNRCEDEDHTIHGERIGARPACERQEREARGEHAH
jgi:hypothetical protein